MDIEASSKRSRLSHLERSSLRSSSIMSLERLSLPRNSSLSRRVSLLSAMDLEVSRHSSKLDFLGEQEGNRLSGNQRESVVYEYKIDVEEKDLNRHSNFKVTHECTCSEQGCMTVHCVCFLTPREICVIGQCCPTCISAKNEYLRTIRGFELERDRRERKLAEQESNPLHHLKNKNYRNMHYYKHTHADEPAVKDLTFCTCKKSHCQKKYCLCFDKGIKCGEFCVCLQCENKDEEAILREQEQMRWERYATYKPYDESQEQSQEIDGNIEQFISNEQEKEGAEGLTMQFQPVNFDRILNQYWRP